MFRCGTSVIVWLCECDIGLKCQGVGVYWCARVHVLVCTCVLDDNESATEAESDGKRDGGLEF